MRGLNQGEAVCSGVSSRVGPCACIASILPLQQLYVLFFIPPIKLKYCTYSHCQKLVQRFELLPHRGGLRCVLVCVQLCKVMGWTCWVGFAAPWGWISTSAHTYTLLMRSDSNSVSAAALLPANRSKGFGGGGKWLYLTGLEDLIIQKCNLQQTDRSSHFTAYPFKSLQ